MTCSYQLFNEDCFETFSRLEDGSVDLVLCDPPYGTTACKWDSVIPLEPMWGQLRRVAKRNAPIVLFGGEPFSSRLRTSALDLWKYDWVWEKEQSHTPLNAKFQPLKVHEEVLVFGQAASTYSPKGTMSYQPQMEDGDPYTRGRRKDGKHRFHSKSIDIPSIKNPGTRYPRSVIRFNRETGLHPTQKPVALMEYMIKTYSNEGDTVLDFTMGSGTTGVACGNLNRNFIGCDSDTEHGYFQIAEQRIGEAYAKQISEAV